MRVVAVPEGSSERDVRRERVELALGVEDRHLQLRSSSEVSTPVAVWTNARFRSSETASYTGKIEASTISLGGSWQAPAVVSPSNSFAPTLALGANGSATAAWVSESSTTQSIEAADYKPS